MTVVQATWETEIEGSLDPGDTLSQNTEQHIRNDEMQWNLRRDTKSLEGTQRGNRGRILEVPLEITNKQVQ